MMKTLHFDTQNAIRPCKAQPVPNFPLQIASSLIKNADYSTNGALYSKREMEQKYYFGNRSVTNELFT